MQAVAAPPPPVDFFFFLLTPLAYHPYYKHPLHCTMDDLIAQTLTKLTGATAAQYHHILARFLSADVRITEVQQAQTLPVWRIQQSIHTIATTPGRMLHARVLRTIFNNHWPFLRESGHRFTLVGGGGRATPAPATQAPGLAAFLPKMVVDHPHFPQHKPMWQRLVLHSNGNSSKIHNLRYRITVVFQTLFQHHTADGPARLPENLDRTEILACIRRHTAQHHTAGNPHRSTQYARQVVMHIRAVWVALGLSVHPTFTNMATDLATDPDAYLAECENHLYQPPVPTVGRNYFTEQEMAQLLLPTPGRSLRDQCILLLLAETGMRRRAVAWLRVSAVYDLIGDRPLPVAYSKEKNGHTRAFVIGPRLRDAVHNYMQMRRGGDWLFPSRRNAHMHISGRVVNHVVQKAAAQCGIQGPHVHAHSIRHVLLLLFVLLIRRQRGCSARRTPPGPLCLRCPSCRSRPNAPRSPRDFRTAVPCRPRTRPRCRCRSSRRRRPSCASGSTTCGSSAAQTPRAASGPSPAAGPGTRRVGGR